MYRPVRGVFGAVMDGFGARPRVSSNTFASGSNQNCGNVISDTPTTRVARPPGGTSSFSLSWDEGGGSAGPPVNRGKQIPAAGQTTRASPNPIAKGYNPNHGNVLSETPSTRVASPPGGASSLSIGMGGSGIAGASPGRRPPPALATDLDNYLQSTGLQQLSPQSATHTPTGPPTPQKEASPSQFQTTGSARAAEAFGSRPRESSNSYASGSDQNAGNVLTGVPTTRVNKPPGGQSAVRLSWDDAANAQAQPRLGKPLSPSGMRGPPLSEGQCSGGGGRGSFAQDGAFGARSHRVTSNTFATGSDQNCGNMISDTPSTRVNKPPGGASSFRLSWD